ncbi:carboxypeptidase B2-like [Polyodon spathula]|uniref:carboxypeptidase B2-like n=1 Tax=Polyodon spathula TaxID=7913 RepID=UPI001B7E00AD|nr:carboxypeptidase B2-like [Polyodon spathula]
MKMKLPLLIALLASIYTEDGTFASISDQVFSITLRTDEEVEIVKNITRKDEIELCHPDSAHNIKINSDVHLYMNLSDLDFVKDLLHKNGIKYKYVTHFYPFGCTLTGRKNSARRAMWVDYGIHSREWISPAFCIWFVQNAIDSYNKNPEITQMLGNMKIYMLMDMCILGQRGFTLLTYTGYREGRLSIVSSKGASPDPCDSAHCGPYPESEPKVSVVAKFLREKKDNMKLYLTIHSYGQMLLFPYSYSYNQAPNHDELQHLADEATHQIQIYYRTRYTSGPGATTIYLAPGGSDDWGYDLGIKYYFTIELRDKGSYGFLLPPQLIQPTCLEVLTAIKTITRHVILRIGNKSCSACTAH